MPTIRGVRSGSGCCVSRLCGMYTSEVLAILGNHLKKLIERRLSCGQHSRGDKPKSLVHEGKNWWIYLVLWIHEPRSTCDNTFRSARPVSSIECRKRRSSRHNCHSFASMALIRSRTASELFSSSCSRLWSTNKYDPAVLRRFNERQLYNGGMKSATIECRISNIYLEQPFRISYYAEQVPPTRQLCFSCTTDDDVERDIEMVQKFNYCGQNGVGMMQDFIFFVKKSKVWFDDCVKKNF